MTDDAQWALNIRRLARQIAAHEGIVGIGADGVPTHGYDGGLDDDRLSAEQKRELAEQMIARWRAYLEAIG